MSTKSLISNALQKEPIYSENVDVLTLHTQVIHQDYRATREKLYKGPDGVYKRMLIALSIQMLEAL